MISAIKEFGDLLIAIKGKTPADDSLETYIEPIDSKKYPQMYSIVITDMSNPKYQKIDIEEITTEDSKKYLYKKGSTNGSNFTPTAFVTELEKTYDLKILGWFKMLKKKKEIYKKYEKSLKAMEEALKNSKDAIINEIKNAKESNKQSALTIKIGEKYLHDIEEFKDIFQKLILEKENRLAEDNKTCSVCGAKSKKVSGGNIPFKFYTIDKPGFITGEFNQELSWRNFPVCSGCTLSLIEGKRFLEKNMKFSFHGLSFLLIPNFIWSDAETKDEVISILSGENKKIQIKKESQDSWITTEDDILHYLSEYEDHLSLHFLFIKSENSADRILLVIDDVLPSRLRKIFNTKSEVDKIWPKFPYDFRKIRRFFSKSDPGKRNNDLDKYFLEITNSIFKGIPLDHGFLAANFMREIRRDFINEEDGFFYKTIDALETTKFLSLLGLIKEREVKALDLIKTEYDEIFEKYNEQLKTNERRAIFLMGALTKMLLNIQMKNRNAQPFMVQLKGLKMNEKDVMGLLPKVQNKLIEYGSFDKGKQSLAQTITGLLLASPEKWRLTVDEINFFFACGMNLYREINKILYGKEDETSDIEEQV